MDDTYEVKISAKVINGDDSTIENVVVVSSAAFPGKAIKQAKKALRSYCKTKKYNIKFVGKPDVSVVFTINGKTYIDIKEYYKSVDFKIQLYLEHLIFSLEDIWWGQII